MFDLYVLQLVSVARLLESEQVFHLCRPSCGSAHGLRLGVVISNTGHGGDAERCHTNAQFLTFLITDKT